MDPLLSWQRTTLSLDKDIRKNQDVEGFGNENQIYWGYDLIFYSNLVCYYTKILVIRVSIDNGTASVVYVKELRVFDLYKMSYWSGQLKFLILQFLQSRTE